MPTVGCTPDYFWVLTIHFCSLKKTECTVVAYSENKRRIRGAISASPCLSLDLSADCVKKSFAHPWHFKRCYGGGGRGRAAASYISSFWGKERKRKRKREREEEEEEVKKRERGTESDRERKDQEREREREREQDRSISFHSWINLEAATCWRIRWVALFLTYKSKYKSIFHLALIYLGMDIFKCQ